MNTTRISRDRWIHLVLYMWHSDETFDTWLKETYGLVYSKYSNIYDIVDDKKYLLYLLSVFE